MYTIQYFKEVIEKDFKLLNKQDKILILEYIEKKLQINPLIFGKPLTKELKNCYRLRFKHFRIVYQIKNQELIVLVIAIGNRKDNFIYNESTKRLS